MKKIALSIISTILLIGYVLPLSAAVRLPAIISSHMVVQQNSKVNFWGWSEPGEKITIKAGWDTATYTTTATGNAKWNIIISTPKAGGLFEISIKGENEIELEDVLIGEVWLCSGQSNMEMNVNWGLPYQEDVSQATNNSIRFFNVAKTTAEYPQEDLKGEWVVCSPATMKNFSAVGYFFGKKIQEETTFPVGLINSSWGGTPAEVWTPQEMVENDTVLKPSSQRNPAKFTGWPVSPGLTYNAMIYPLINYPIAGTIWYQGESNVDFASSYKLLLTTMIGEWRKAWKTSFPFYYVQIAPFTYGNKNTAPLLGEAQTTALSYPKTGMVVVHDLVDNVNDIHPKMKKEVGLRLADLALADTYGKDGLAYKSPMYKSMKVEKGKIRIAFENATEGLVSKGGAPSEFYVAGADKNFVPATAKIEGNTVVVFNKSITDPVAVRFGFSNAAMPNLFSKSGLPVNIFRTDDWPVETGPEKK